MQSKTAACVRN